jgi:ribosomal protein S15P/S13E
MPLFPYLANAISSGRLLCPPRRGKLIYFRSVQYFRVAFKFKDICIIISSDAQETVQYTFNHNEDVLRRYFYSGRLALDSLHHQLRFLIAGIGALALGHLHEKRNDSESRRENIRTLELFH